MEKRSWIVMVLAASLLGCAVSEPPQRDFADFRMSDLEPLPDFEVESNQLISECQVRRSPPLNESIDGELSATTRIVSAADRNGVRDSTTLNVTWPTASMDAQVLLIDESSCEVIATLDIPDGEVTWDGRVDDVQAPPGVYIAQLASIDGQRLGESIALLVVAEDDPCDLPDAAIDWVYDGVVTSRSDGQHLRIEREGPVHLCIDARTLDGERVPPSIDVNGFRAFSQPMAIGPSRVRFGFPSYGPEHSLQLFQVSGRVSWRVGVLPGSRPSAPA